MLDSLVRVFKTGRVGDRSTPPRTANLRRVQPQPTRTHRDRWATETVCAREVRTPATGSRRPERRRRRSLKRPRDTTSGHEPCDENRLKPTTHVREPPANCHRSP
ncbi:hypothetical protein HNY73_013702 [Argiope bruennichi]|uniref:Uncharacterized protein n=1 Tax=Argiope bruennichi TaxID=94029 RepID=A0A8T0ETA9_ARGBR|nr:hypothetical protein HNY73_013702 [Argiope bruennichi]